VSSEAETLEEEQFEKEPTDVVEGCQQSAASSSHR
jgi:hypothetical protein